MLNKAIGRDGQKLISDANPDYLHSVLAPIVSAAGYIPSDAVELLTGVVGGVDPKKREDALAFLASFDPQVINASVPSSSPLGKDVALFKQLSPYYSPDELAAKFVDRQDLNKRQALDKLGEDAAKIYDENVDSASLNDTFDPGFFTRLLPGAQRPDLPITEEQQALLTSEHKALFVEGYKLTQNADQARKFADTQIKQHWGTSTIGYSENMFGYNTPPRIVRDGVATFYQGAKVDGSLDWINSQVRGELGISADQQFVLLSDAQTVREGDSFKAHHGVDANGNPLGNASYKIAYMDKQGKWEIAMNDDRSILRLNFEHSPELTKSIDDRHALVNAQARENAALSQVL